MSHIIDTQNRDLNDFRQQVFRTATQDGLIELVMGCAFVLAAIPVGLDLALDTPMFYLIGIPVIVFGFVLEALRQRYTHPRIGYVELFSAENHRLVQHILTGTTIMGLVVMLATLLALLLGQPVMPMILLFEGLALVLGVFFGVAWLYVAIRYGIVRFYALGILSIFLGGIAQVIDITSLSSENEPIARWLVYFVLMAVILIPVGMLMLIQFIRKNPVLDV